MGFLGILEDPKARPVPATIILSDIAEVHATVANLKHGRGRNKHVVLSPQPSDDPNDPLNFSTFQKNLMFGVTALGTAIFACTISPLLTAGIVPISVALNVSIPALILASGYQLLVVACTTTIVGAVARKWGKRPVFLASGLFGLIGSAIGSSASTYNTLLAGRVIQGFSTAAYESVFISMIGDIFFLHESGSYLSIANFVFSSVSGFSSIVCGSIVKHLGWKYLFYFLVLFGGLQTLCQFLFVPESQYIREGTVQQQPVNLDDTTEESKSGPAVQVENHLNVSPPQKKSWAQQLAIFKGTYSNDKFFALILAPFVCCSNLGVLWSVMVSGYFFSLYPAILYILAQIFAAPPYLMDPEAIGNLCLAPFLGGLVAGVFGALTMDPVAKWCSRKNKGVYEPEYRLVLGLGGILTTVGLVAFGYTTAKGDSFYLTAFLHGVAVFGITCVLISTSSYVLDAYREMRTEIFLASIAVKNLFAFAYSYFFNNWVASAGIFYVMWVMGTVAAVLWLSYPLMFFFGKRYRGYWSRHNIMAKLGISVHDEY